MALGRMDVALIGYQDQGNLGMGYLASAAHIRGHRVELFDIRDGVDRIVAALEGQSPVVVGFSLYLLYGRTGWFGSTLSRHGIHVLFALPAIVLATIFV